MVDEDFHGFDEAEWRKYLAWAENAVARLMPVRCAGSLVAVASVTSPRGGSVLLSVYAQDQSYHWPGVNLAGDYFRLPISMDWVRELADRAMYVDRRIEETVLTWMAS
jgi:hypothetical protein